MAEGNDSLEFCSEFHPMYSAERSAPVFVSIAVIVGSTHFAFRPHLRLVHLPRVVRRLEMPAQAPLQFRSIRLDPSPDGDVIHREPAPDQKLLRINLQIVLATIRNCSRNQTWAGSAVSLLA